MNEIADQLDAAHDRLQQGESPPGFLTVEEAAELVRCSTKTIRRAFTAGVLRAFKPTTRVLLKEDDVRAWVESHPVAQPERSRPGVPRRRVSGNVQVLRDMDPDLRR